MENDDKLASEKMDFLYSTSPIKREFRVQMNFEEAIMDEFISFLRFVEFDEEIETLYEIED